jgi:uncharacterized protein
MSNFQGGFEKLAMALDRLSHVQALSGLLKRHRAVAILGCRQVGKTTLARAVAAQHAGPVTFFDLEDSQDLARLENPQLALEGLRGLVVLDEIQRRPELFPALRVLIDRPRAPRYLILGSASPDLLRQSSESLAGRIFYHHLDGLALDEVGASNLDRLWLRGGFPRSYLAASARGSQEWRSAYIRTFFERDLPQLGVMTPAATLERFWAMLAHYHGQVWSALEFARSFAVSDATVRRYLDLLAGTYMIRLLQPWHENLSKRQVKAPKVYFADSGLLHSILRIGSARELEVHPKLGASWEGFLLHQVLARLRVPRQDAFFWATHAGAELDLLVLHGQKRYGFEFKRTDAPRITPSMRTALVDLKLTSLDVLHAGSETFPLAENVRAVAARRLLEDVKPLR